MTTNSPRAPVKEIVHQLNTKFNNTQMNIIKNSALWNYMIIYVNTYFTYYINEQRYLRKYQRPSQKILLCINPRRRWRSFNYWERGFNHGRQWKFGGSVTKIIIKHIFSHVLSTDHRRIPVVSDIGHYVSGSELICLPFSIKWSRLTHKSKPAGS